MSSGLAKLGFLYILHLKNKFFVLDKFKCVLTLRFRRTWVILMVTVHMSIFFWGEGLSAEVVKPERGSGSSVSMNFYC